MTNLIQGDCLSVLPTLPADSVHCVVTSPPYFALRSYLSKGHPDKPLEIGSEPTPEAFVKTMVDVFREVRRVLHPSGTLWLNIGDSYDQGNKSASCGKDDKQPARRFGVRATENGGGDCGPGQLLNMPHRVAEALRADGWIWRQTIAFVKRSPMPESVSGWRWTRCKVKVGDARTPHPSQSEHGLLSRSLPGRIGGESVMAGRVAQWQDCPGCPKCLPNGGLVLRRGKGRCTSSFEYIFLFAKGDRYFYDSAAAVEQAGGHGSGNKTKRWGQNHTTVRSDGIGDVERCSSIPWQAGCATRNYRNFWLLSSEPTKEKHFAAYPSELVRRCLTAGTSAGGVCPKCLMPWAPVVEATPEYQAALDATGEAWYPRVSGDKRDGGPKKHEEKFSVCAEYKTLSYRPTCTCGCPDSIPATVLDCFAGTGTTLQVARHMGRAAIGIELNSEYIDIANRRIPKTPRCFKTKEANHHKPAANARTLFD